jgi:hypothetical protein
MHTAICTMSGSEWFVEKASLLKSISLYRKDWSIWVKLNVVYATFFFNMNIGIKFRIFETLKLNSKFNLVTMQFIRVTRQPTPYRAL